MRRWSSSRFRLLIVSVVAGCAVSLGSSLVVQGSVASAATRTVNIANPGAVNSYAGEQVDAVIDSSRHTVTVVQRNVGLFMPSHLRVRWFNTSTGRGGTAALTGLARVDRQGETHDRFAVLSTGPGRVAIFVSGRTPSRTALILIPDSSEAFGNLTPSGVLVNV